MQIHELTAPGVHLIDRPVPLPSGTHLLAQPGARLVGGVSLHPQKTDGRTYTCDLRRAGIEPADMVSRGFGRKISPSHNQLYINGEPLSLSRYPRAGNFLTISAVGEPIASPAGSGAMRGGFFYEDDRPRAWRPSSSVRIFGYWAYDWSPTYEIPESFDPVTGFIRTAQPYAPYHYTVGQRFCFYNIPEEVTEPGDYCIDFASGILTFIPPDGCDMESAEIFLSVCDRPVFELEGVSDVTIEGFVIEAFRGTALTLRNCSRITVASCTFRNIGNRAVCVDDSTEIHIRDCHVYHTGDGGIAFYCGDRVTLSPAHCSVEHCHLHDIADWDRCYEPPIRLYGVGLSAIGNRIHDCPHAGILFGGNEIDIRYNELYRVVTETGDAGAIYGGRDYTFRGIRIVGNFLHHIRNDVGLGTMGIYNDDAISGTRMEDNVFYKVRRAVFLGGGVDFIIRGNLFIDCHPAIEADGRGQSPAPTWRNMVLHTLRDRFYNIAGSGHSAAEPPYITRYPELGYIDRCYRTDAEPMIPPSALIENNLFCGGERLHLTWCCEGARFTETGSRELERSQLERYLTAEQYRVVSES